ncbi:MAG: hypothetical protein ISS82_04265 [Nanoarchaeota archaeon]|nr:hypothetical protein [Nanoarchaeota archaeon]
MFDTILCRYGEIALKGKNRIFFEKKLVENIMKCFKENKVDFDKIIRVRGRIIIKSKEKCDCLKNVFGLTSFSRAIETDLDLDKMKENSLRLYKKGSFRISAHRINKIFLSSKELNEKVGEFIIKKKKAKVNLGKPDIDIGIEIVNNKSYVFSEKVKCLGGLPVGVTGLVSLLLQDKNSLKAGYLMLKRGCCLEIVKNKIRNKKINYNTLKKYSYGCSIKEVKKPSKKSKSLVVNDTLDNIKNYKTGLVVLRPLI